MVMASSVPARTVNGFIANAATTLDPQDPYPTSNPASGFTAQGPSYAGIIHGQPTDGSAAAQPLLHRHQHQYDHGFGYGLGTWDAATVPNVGYVARLLNEYYPHTDEPATLTDPPEGRRRASSHLVFQRPLRA